MVITMVMAPGVFAAPFMAGINDKSSTAPATNHYLGEDSYAQSDRGAHNRS
jgi:hypothetical protein